MAQTKVLLTIFNPRQGHLLFWSRISSNIGGVNWNNVISSFNERERKKKKSNFDGKCINWSEKYCFTFYSVYFHLKRKNYIQQSAIYCKTWECAVLKLLCSFKQWHCNYCTANKDINLRFILWIPRINFWLWINYEQ